MFPLLLLLSSGCYTLCSHIQREYHFLRELMPWQEARMFCRKEYTDLATIGSLEDMKTMVNMTPEGVTEEFWIGMVKTNVSSWYWSIGETYSSQGLIQYENWAEPNSPHHCGGMRHDGKWIGEVCETKLAFVCQNETGSFHVVPEKKSWREALEHCRASHKDFASAMSSTENWALHLTLNESGSLAPLVWIGLFRDRWKWIDGTDSSFRNWERSQPNSDGHCSLYNPSAKKIFDRGCLETHFVYCYKAKKKIHIVRMEIKSDSVFDFTDPSVSEAILKEIQDKNKGLKLQWRVQPDGKIFHKIEKKKKDEF